MGNINKIDPERWYSLGDLVEQRLLPWVTSYQGIRNTVAKDRAGEDLLKARVEGRKPRKKYHFKGENIIRFIKSFEAANPQRSTK